jgi:hypothetical protein
LEGWVRIEADNFEDRVIILAYQFLDTVFIIDDLLAEKKALAKIQSGFYVI